MEIWELNHLLSLLLIFSNTEMLINHKHLHNEKMATNKHQMKARCCYIPSYWTMMMNNIKLCWWRDEWLTSACDHRFLVIFTFWRMQSTFSISVSESWFLNIPFIQVRPIIFWIILKPFNEPRRCFISWFCCLILRRLVLDWIFKRGVWASERSWAFGVLSHFFILEFYNT